MSDDRLPTSLWVDAHLHRLSEIGTPYYIINKGAPASGMVLLKINSLDGQCAVLTQQRDLDGNMGWIHALNEETIEEQKADDYITRSLSRDSDLWVIEIEDKERQNPFEGEVF